jgi:membrane-associated protease RseP (regulator of RpoE activity)
MHVVAMRGDERLELDLQLIEKLLPYDRPFLGVLPQRAIVTELIVAVPPAAGQPGVAAPEQPVVVRYVYADGPAAKAGIQAGDSIVAISGQAVRGFDDLVNRIAAGEVGSKLGVKVQRGTETLDLEVTLATQPTVVPAELPPAYANLSLSPPEKPAVGRSSIKIPEFKNECLVYVPKNYDPRVASGLLVWLHGTNGPKDEELLERWSALCDANNTILLAPKAANGSRWLPPELDFIRKTIDQARATYSVDANRIAAVGPELGGQIAYVLAFGNPGLIRGVAAIDAPLAGRMIETDPAHLLAIYTTKAQKGRTSAAIAAGVERLKTLKFPVTIHDLGESGRDLKAEELPELLRWIDTLDRL